MNAYVKTLVESTEPSLQWLARTRILHEDPNSESLQVLQMEIRNSRRVKTLLENTDSSVKKSWLVYAKWQGAHWVLALLSEIGYPKGDPRLVMLRDMVLDWLNSREHERHIRQINGLWRRCGSQEGYALYSQVVLGIADERADALARRLLSWQWPDGGWNCDRNKEAKHSSFHESWLPMRALWRYSLESGDKDLGEAAQRTAERFLSHDLFKRSSDGSPIDSTWLNLHFPRYWHYDVLGALDSMRELGRLDDPRCKPGLDWLESRMLPDGGFPADEKYYRVSQKAASGKSAVDWGGTRKNTSNPWVSVQALSVLNAAGRLK